MKSPKRTSPEPWGSGVFQFKLPNELLLRIFHNFVKDDKKHSPVVLSHVCKLWRQLALSTSGLWSVVDIQVGSVDSARAKYHLALSQKQPLAVTLLLPVNIHHQEPLNLDEFEWIFSQSSRLAHLSLAQVYGPGGTYVPISIAQLFNRFRRPQGLSKLQSLMISGLAWFFGNTPCDFGHIPSLRILNLSRITIEASNFKDTIRFSPLLETLVLSRLVIAQIVTEGSTAPVELSHLKFCALEALTFEDQGFFTSIMILPKQCRLDITVEGVTFYNSYKVLHPATITMLQPIQFTTICLDGWMIFTEEPQDCRCAFKLKLDPVSLEAEDMPSGWDPIMSHGFDLDSVTTLVIGGSIALLDYDGNYVLRILDEIMPRIRKLVIRRCALDELSTTMLGIDIPGMTEELETLVLQEITLDTCSDDGPGNVEAARRFIGRILASNREVLRLVLRDCEVNQEALDKLSAVLPVDMDSTCNK